MIFSSNQRHFSLAFGLAINLMLLSGWEYRQFIHRLSRPGGAAILPQGMLAKLPCVLGEWIGKDLPPDPAVVRAQDADDYLTRSYVRRAGTERIELFIRCGSRTRDLMPHQPEVCFPGNGWSLHRSVGIRLPEATGQSLECRMYRFDRQGLEYGSMVVLNYYIIDGQNCPDVSRLQSRALRGGSGFQYLAQIQIACFVGTSLVPEAAEKSVKDFAVKSALEIRKLFPNV